MTTLYCRIPSNWFADPSLCWLEWQTLIGGLLALLGAWLTVNAVRNQIKQAEIFRQDELRRRHIAARALLPQALSEISDYCQSIVVAVADEIEIRHFGEQVNWAAELAPDGNPKILRSQQLPLSALSALQPFIETLNEKRDVRHVAELIASLQILASRYGCFNLHDANVVDNLYGRILDAAKVRMLTHSMFNYARFLDQNPFGVVGAIPQADVWDKIHGEAHGLLFSRKNCDQFFPEINRRIEGYKKRDYTPWNEKFGE